MSPYPSIHPYHLTHPSIHIIHIALLTHPSISPCPYPYPLLSKSMDRTMLESQQLDLLFDHMLKNRGLVSVSTASATDLLPSMSMLHSRRHAAPDDDTSCSEYADESSSAYCSEAGSSWAGGVTLLLLLLLLLHSASPLAVSHVYPPPPSCLPPTQ